jgi:hypothetical protein
MPRQATTLLTGLHGGTRCRRDYHEGVIGTELPVRGSLLYWLWWSPATTRVGPGRIECRALGPRIVHTDPVVWFVHSRLAPQPTMVRHTIEFVTERGFRAYLCSWHSIEPARPVLEEAGFSVRDRSVWTVPCGGPAWMPRIRSVPPRA